jgi:hypothetical protein
MPASPLTETAKKICEYILQLPLPSFAPLSFCF